MHDDPVRVVLRCYRVFGASYTPKDDVLRFLFAELDENSALQLYSHAFTERGEHAALSAAALDAASAAAENEALSDSEPLAAVTRRFLEDVLAEAGVPSELMDLIVTTYRDGAITMSEDGGRYIVHLTPSS